MNTKTKAVMGVAAAGIFAITAAGCSSDSGSSTSSTSSASPVSTAPVAQIDNLTGVDTAVALDSSFTDALTTLKLTPGTVGTAKLKDGSLIFPITGGNVTYYTPGSVTPYVQGTIDHKGSGFSLEAGNTKVDLTNFTIDPGVSKLYGDVSVNGKQAAKQAYLFNLDGSTLKPLQTGPNNTAILTGTRVLISADAAAVLNDTFKTTAVQDQMLVGVATITVNTK
ncbi:MAG: hypothetical protein WBB44_06070 [Candidatus Nanopelagicales bacterium]|nr:hypothetical protein [Candidatus Nanopelagicales bacterium]